MFSNDASLASGKKDSSNAFTGGRSKYKGCLAHCVVCEIKRDKKKKQMAFVN